MPTLPNDDRSWVAAEFDINDPLEKSAIGILVAAAEDGGLQVLGSAFVIYGGGRGAVCIGAAHSFDTVKQQQLRKMGKQPHLIPPDFQQNDPVFIDAKEIHAFFMIDGSPVTCAVDQINYINHNDLAIFTAIAPEGSEPFQKNISVGMAAPIVGDVVGVIANDISLKSTALGSGRLTLNFGLRLGVVTEVNWGFSPLGGQSFCFKTTIPTTSGMSGAPVVVNPIPGSPVVVCGAVSSDFSEPEAFTSFKTEGLSTASMLWPAAGLALTVATNSDEPKWHLLGDLIESGLIENHSDRVKVYVSGDEDMHEVHYLDSRNTPPQILYCV